MDPAKHLSGSQLAYMLPMPTLYAACLKSCLNQIAITQSAQLCWQISQTGATKTSNNQQDPSLRLLNTFLCQEYPVSTHGENQILLFLLFFLKKRQRAAKEKEPPD